MFYAYFIGILASPLKGYCLDLFGRRLTIAVSVSLLGVPLFLFPRVDDLWYEFNFCRILLSIFLLAPFNNPLITDYIQKGSRGMAVAMLSFTRHITNLIVIGVFMNLAAIYSLKFSFTLLAFCMFGMGTLLMHMLKEPKL